MLQVLGRVRVANHISQETSVQLLYRDIVELFEQMANATYRSYVCTYAHVNYLFMLTSGQNCFVHVYR